MGLSFTFSSKVGAALSSLDQAVPRALEKCGMVAEGYAKQACPVDTGRLRNSITHVLISSNTVVIGTNVEYAAYVELGTSRMPARPFIKPAAEGHGDQYRQIIQAELSK